MNFFRFFRNTVTLLSLSSIFLENLIPPQHFFPQGGNFRLSNNGSKTTIENKGTHTLNSSLLLSLKGPERAFFVGGMVLLDICCRVRVGQVGAVLEKESFFLC